jgi:hypothetical protein
MPGMSTPDRPRRRTPVIVLALAGVLVIAGGLWWGLRETPQDRAVRAGDRVLDAMPVAAGYELVDKYSGADDAGVISWLRTYRVHDNRLTESLLAFVQPITAAGAIPHEDTTCAPLVCAELSYPPYDYPYRLTIQVGADLGDDGCPSGCVQISVAMFDRS